MADLAQQRRAMADRARMHDPLMNLLWLLALQLAARRRIRIDLSTWPTSYEPRARA